MSEPRRLAKLKSLGQHFLRDQKVVQTIVEAACEAQGVLEIGAGDGALTSELAARRKLVAVEIDRGRALELQARLPDAKILHADALAMDLASELSSLPQPRAIVSNMPYNITGPLLERVTGVRESIAFAVLMMQREVATRILADAGDRNRGAMSVSIQHDFEVEKMLDVPPGAFSPPPKVHSVVLRFRPRAGTRDDSFTRCVRAGFQQPRKCLANNLASVESKPLVESCLRGLGMSATVRPHELTEAQWKQLSQLLARSKSG